MRWRDRFAADETSFGFWPRVLLTMALVIPLRWVLGGVLAMALATRMSPLPHWLEWVAALAPHDDVFGAVVRMFAGTLLIFGAYRYLGDVWRPTHHARLADREAARLERNLQHDLTEIPSRISNPEQPLPKRW